jgi:hypothetical protein
VSVNQRGYGDPREEKTLLCASLTERLPHRDIRAVLFRTAHSRLAVYRWQVLWLIVGVVVTGVIVPFSLSRWTRREQEKGSVSGRWLAEYRQHHES